MKIFRPTRRRFFFLSAVGLAAGAGYYWYRKPVRVALIGAGGQGTNLARGVGHTRRPGGPPGEIVAVCDVDSEHAVKVRDEFAPRAETYADYQRVLERDDVEAVIVATPDHWHARIAHDALHAGKAVYGEKPLGLTVAEGQLLVRTVEDTGGVFQGGTMQRTHRRFITACEMVRGGRLGKVHKVVVTLPQRWKGDSQGPFATSAPPAHLDWERWLGQAPQVDYCKERCHGFFRRWYEYSGGQMTDWGAHHLDAVYWALRLDDSGPLSVQGTAEIPRIRNGFNTPLAFSVNYELSGGVQVEVGTSSEGPKCGVRIEGDQGWLEVNRDVLTGSSLSIVERVKSSWGWTLNPFASQLQQFFACVRDRCEPNSSVTSMHRSSTACHLANIAMRLGRKLYWDAEGEVFVADAEANGMLTRVQRSPYGLPI